MVKKTLILVIVGIVLAAVLGSYLLLRGFQEATEPIVGLRSEISTQVAQLLHPTPTVLPDPITVVHEVRALARLETMQYTVEKVITAETGQGPFGFLFGDRLLLVAHGTIIAGVDLDRVGADDVSVDERGRVHLDLPAAEIFISALDNDKTYVFDREVGLLRKGDVQLESAARLAAEQEMAKAALEDGILEQAQLNAEAYLYRLLRSLGFADVVFNSPVP
jgi:hypothetical protein